MGRISVCERREKDLRMMFRGVRGISIVVEKDSLILSASKVLLSGIYDLVRQGGLLNEAY